MRIEFQSSPARGGGCNPADVRRSRRRMGVSILTRPWGRVQPSSVRRAPNSCAGFNPHPPVGAGATCRGGTRRFGSSSGFNPHPPVGAGATPELLHRRTADAVSILTRPWGRVQPKHATELLMALATFQSSPARGGGCNDDRITAEMETIRAVSILTRPWGRVQQNHWQDRCSCCSAVSILTRPWGRVQRLQDAVRMLLARVSILTRPWGRVQLRRA